MVTVWIGVKPKAVVTSPLERLSPVVIRPCASTVTFVYVPAVTPVVERLRAIVPAPVIGEPETDIAESPETATLVTVPPDAPATDPLDAEVIRPCESTVIEARVYSPA